MWLLLIYVAKTYRRVVSYTSEPGAHRVTFAVEQNIKYGDITRIKFSSYIMRVAVTKASRFVVFSRLLTNFLYEKRRRNAVADDRGPRMKIQTPTEADVRSGVFLAVGTLFQRRRLLSRRIAGKGTYTQ